MNSFASKAVDGGITAAKGFRAAGVPCGIKAKGPDFALIASDVAASAGGVFTTNRAQAAPIVVSRRNLRATHGRAVAIAVNSGCANACTGADGLHHAEAMAAQTAAALGCTASEVLVASTGVIGVKLDMSKIARGISDARAALAPAGGAAAARAIMTTDPFPKEYAVTLQTERGTFTVGGTAKGSGMIEPKMATMLGFLTTDASVPPALLHRGLVESARDTFNAITVDGECSTNDTLIAMASGASGVAIDEESYPALL